MNAKIWLAISISVTSFQLLAQCYGDFEYEYVADGIAITGCSVANTATSIILPSSIDGIDVVEISESACAALSRKDLQTLVLPSHVKRIKAYAFYNQLILDIEFPETLEVLDLMFFGVVTESTNPKPCYYSGYVQRVLFWGHCPTITNTTGINRTNDSGYTGMFWRYQGATYAFVDERWINEYNEGNGGYYTSNIKFFQGAQLKPGFVSLDITSVPGTTSQGDYSIVLQCPNESGKIYYTIDGSTPEEAESEHCFLYDGPINVSSAFTLKAIVSVKSTESWVNAENVKMSNYSYIKEASLLCKSGYVHAPTILSSAGTPFEKKNNRIEISCDIADAIIRYTLDNSAVTSNSPIYTSSLSISG